MGFDPYLEWLKIPADRRPLDFYLLLGIPRDETDADRIRGAAATRWELVKTHVSGPHEEHARRILKELSKAAACLTDPQKRKAYDSRLPAGPRAEAAPPSRPRLDQPKHGEKRVRSVPQVMLAPFRAIDGGLRALAGEGNPALHNLLRGLAVVGVIGVIGVIVVGIGLVFLTIPGGSDREPAEVTTTQEAPPRVEKAPAISPEELDDLYEAWQALYAAQEKNKTWPKELGDEFQRAMSALGPNDEISLKYRELYRDFILQHFPTLYELGDIRLPAQRDPSGQIKRDADGNPLKMDPFDNAARRADEYDYYDSMEDVGPASITRQEALVGKVEWNLADLKRIRGGLSWSTSPTTTQVRLAQEDLWACEAILRVIAKTNAGATSHGNAAVKRIDALEIGQRAAPAFARSGAGAPFAGESMESYESDYGDMAASPRGMGMPGSMASSGAPSDEQVKQQLAQGRYVDQDGVPLEADPSNAPFAVFKMLPVRMLLLVDQRRVPKLLVNCANSSMPLEVRRVTLNPGNAGTWYGGAMGPSMGMGVAPSERPLGIPPGTPATPPGMFGGPGDMSHDEYDVGAYGEEGYGGTGMTAYPGAGGRESHGLVVEIQAVIHIFNPPDREKLGTGSAPGGVAATAEHMLGSVERRVRWLELLRVVNACLPKDDPAERPEDVMLRNELHVTGLQCRRAEKLEDWFASVRNWYQPPAPAEGGQSASGASATQAAKKAGPQGPGWVVELTGYHYHNHPKAASSNQGAQFVRDTLIRSLHTKKFKLPVPGKPSATAEVSAADLGIGYASLIDPGRVADVPMPGPQAGERSGADARLRRFDFRVQLCRQPTPIGKRQRQSGEALTYADLAEAISTPIEEELYLTSTPWDPPLLGKRGAPQLYALQDLRGTAGRGAVAMNDRSAKGQRWLVLTGLLPVAKQADAYADVFEDALSFNPARDVPMYVGYQIERAEVGTGGEADQPAWKPIDLKQAFEAWKSFQGARPEVVDYRYVHRPPTIAMPIISPLPPVMNAGWGPEVAHPPEIPLLSDVPESQRRPEVAYGGQMPYGGPLPVTRAIEGGRPSGAGSSAFPNDGGGMPYGGAMTYGPAMEEGMPGYPGSAPAGGQAEFQLFRFLDFSVQPGKRYRYRVKLLLANPNFRVEARLLDSEDLAKQPLLETEWSDPSDVIDVPRDSMLLLGPVKPPRDIDDEPVATVMACTFTIANGLETADLFEVMRGQLADLQKEKETVEREKMQRRPKRQADRGGRSRRSRSDSDEFDEEGAILDMYGFDEESPSRRSRGRRRRSAMPDMSDDYMEAFPQRQPDNKADTEPVSHNTDMLVLDMRGARLGRSDPAVTDPAAMILLDPDGNLLIRDELDDLEEYERYQR